MRQEQVLQRSTNAVREGGDPLYGIERLVYEELKRLLHSSLARSRNPKTIVTAALARLLRGSADRERVAWFYALAASCMRRLLVERATATLLAPQVYARSQTRMRSARLIRLHAALDELQARQPLCARIAELHYFAGCSTKEIAALMNMPIATVIAEFRFARAWLAAASED